jgi:hypothetical protein
MNHWKQGPCRVQTLQNSLHDPDQPTTQQLRKRGQLKPAWNHVKSWEEKRAARSMSFPLYADALISTKPSTAVAGFQCNLIKRYEEINSQDVTTQLSFSGGVKCWSILRERLKPYADLEVLFCSFLTSALKQDEWCQIHERVTLPPAKKPLIKIHVPSSGGGLG